MFARRMIADHTKDLSVLQRLARREDTQLPTGMTPAGQRELDQLASTGRGLDRRYLRGAVHDHQLAIANYRHELATTPSPLIRAYVRATLPVLQSHLRMAQGSL